MNETMTTYQYLNSTSYPADIGFYFEKIFKYTHRTLPMEKLL